MAIVTIARETGAWGKSTAENLAKRMPAILINKELLEESFAGFGKDYDWLNKYDEKKPGLLSVFSDAQETYFMLMKMSLLKTATENENAVILGRGANMLLADVPGCLKVRLCAPLDVRCRRIVDFTGCSEKEALQFIKTNDTHRAGFCNFHYDADWTDYNNYDLIVNTAKLSEEEVAKIILDAVKETDNPVRNGDCRRILADMYLAQCIKKHVIFDCRVNIPIFDVQVVGNGKVVLRGATTSGAISAEAEHAAKECQGVTEVENKIQISAGNINSIGH